MKRPDPRILRMKYAGSGDPLSSILGSATEMSLYMIAHTERTTTTPGVEIRGMGPGGRLIRIRYTDPDGTIENFVETIEISDPFEEEILAKEIESIYRKHNFLPEKPPEKST